MDSRWKIGLVDTKDVAALRAALLDEVSCHDLAGLLKHFLRQLPESLFTVALVDLFAQVAGTFFCNFPLFSLLKKKKKDVSLTVYGAI